LLVVITQRYNCYITHVLSWEIAINGYATLLVIAFFELRSRLWIWKRKSEIVWKWSTTVRYSSYCNWKSTWHREYWCY